MANKIGWCDRTINYIWGCTRGCEYCYARRIAKRFAKNIYKKEKKYYKDNIDNYRLCVKNEHADFYTLYGDLLYFTPTWLESQYAQPLPKKPQRIFLNSMSDIADWKPEWYEKILQKVCENMHHTFIILTKRPEIYRNYTFPHNVWLGVTITKSIDSHGMKAGVDAMRKSENKWFISFEPLAENIFSRHWVGIGNSKTLKKLKPDWLIVGLETGNRKDQIIPKPEWLESFYSLDIPVYMKSACSKIIDTPLRQEWPE